jgi:hypothetical protein
MKTKLLILLFAATLYGCTITATKEPEVIKPQFNYGDNKIPYSVVIIDSCEYIVGWIGSGYGGPIFTHKGDCKNPIHLKQRVTVTDTVRYKLIKEQ